MSDTPRTDETEVCSQVPAHFARTLERELTAAKAEQEPGFYGRAAARLLAERDELLAEVERLRAVAGQALEALEGPNCNCFSGCDVCAEWPGRAETADAIRNALKETK
jgi:hypothetical protein